MSTTLGILFVLLGAAAATALLMGAPVWRERLGARATGRRDTDHVTDVVTQLTTRVDELAGDLQRALERAEQESRRSRFLGEVTASLDVDELVSGALETTAELPSVDAVVVSIDDGDEARVIAAHGMPEELAAAQGFVAPSEAQPDAISVSYRYEDPAPDAIRGAVVRPLRSKTRTYGFIAVYSRREEDLADEVGRALDDVAGRTGPALDNALRYREARRLADLDALTGLHNRRFFHETLARECSRARRYDRRLAVVLIDLDDFKAINERIGHLAGDGVLAEAAQRVLSVVRTCDVACRVGGDEFAVILPEQGIPQAEQLYRRIQLAVSGRPIGAVPRLNLSAGVAELQADDDTSKLFERADQALFQAKNAGKARVFPAIVPEPDANSASAS